MYLWTVIGLLAVALLAIRDGHYLIGLLASVALVYFAITGDQDLSD